MNTSQFSNIPPVVKNLIIINVLMLLAKWVLEHTFGIRLADYLGLHYFKSELFQPYQVVTHIFMHANFMHLFFNMFALWMFGRVLETVWGSKRFFIYFIVTGLGAAVLHSFVTYLEMINIQDKIIAFQNTPTPDSFALLIKKYFSIIDPRYYKEFLTSWYYNADNISNIENGKSLIQSFYVAISNIPTVGASGAVFGVLLAFGMLFPNTELVLLFPPIPIKAKYFVIGYGAIELFAGIMPSQGDNVAHFAHLGGMLFGFILIKLWGKKRTNFY